ncbi:MAG: hypothetical protein A3F18_03615 [Legionellales bacterium RIFCSPHIGHO2_12_FULL_37_14]|nr:MAG: hypothetical protein A3F18_03615 [Legionellales bacterium RIFCSPHIGHO2_12_FULL_37_14]
MDNVAYRSSVRQPQRSRLMQAAWIILAFAFGYLSSTLYDLPKLKSFIEANVVNKLFTKPLSLSKVANPQAAQVKPKFEFYTILAMDEEAPAIIDKPQNLSSEIAPVKPLLKEIAQNANEPYYLLQVAAFSRLGDAEKMQAVMQAKGLKVNIVEAVVKDVTWYRVILGPFKEKGEVEKVQQAIAGQDHVNSIVRRVAA